MSEKEDRFNKVAAARVNRIIDTLRLLGNCANRNNYEYTPQDVEQMFDAINEAVKECQKNFALSPKQEKTPFAFKK